MTQEPVSLSVHFQWWITDDCFICNIVIYGPTGHTICSWNMLWFFKPTNWGITLLLQQQFCSAKPLKPHNYITHNAHADLCFRSCAVSGADWNPESGFNKWVVFTIKVNSFLHLRGPFLNITPTHVRSGRAVVQAGPADPPPVCVVAPRYWHWSAAAPVGVLRVRSSRHAACSLLHAAERRASQDRS